MFRETYLENGQLYIILFDTTLLNMVTVFLVEIYSIVKIDLFKTCISGFKYTICIPLLMVYTVAGKRTLNNLVE